MPTNPILQIMNKTRQRVFNYIHSNNLIYNTCWEDPRIDRTLLKIDSSSEIAMITSAGCNALDYLLDNPAAIHSIDVNSRQNALLELKIEAIKKLNYPTFFDFFGNGQHVLAREIYFDLLREELSDTAKEFWDDKYFYFVPNKDNRTFYYRGTSGNIAWMVHHYLKSKPILWNNVQSLLESKTLEQQQEIFDKIEPELWNTLSKFIVRQPVTMSLLGVPTAQMNLIETQFEGGLYGFIRQSLRHVFTQVPVSDNYFWRVYLTGSYTKECCPEYLKENNFDILRDRLDNIHIHTESIISFLIKNPRLLTHFILLDHQDWLAWHQPKTLIKEWNLIFKNSRVGTKILMRSAGRDIDFIPADILKFLSFKDDETSILHQTDRVGTYASLHFAEIG